MAIWISLEPKRVYPWKNNNNNNNKSLQQSTASAGIQTYIPEMLFSRGAGGGGGAYLFQAHLRQGLIETGGLFERGRLI